MTQGARTERVGEDVCEGGTHIETVTLRADQDPRDDDIDDQAGSRDEQHASAIDLDGTHEARDCLLYDQHAREREGYAIHEGRQHLRAAKAERAAFGARLARPSLCEQREPQGTSVGEHVPRVGDQREASGEVADGGLYDHERRREDQR